MQNWPLVVSGTPLTLDLQKSRFPAITHHVLRDEEGELIETISEKIDDYKTYGIVDVIIDVVPELGHQTLISVAGYKSDNPISYDIDQL